MAVNPDTRPLPEGWIQQFNEEHKAWFYVNTNSPGGAQSSWTHPAENQPGAYAPPPGVPPTKNSYGGSSSYEKERGEYNSTPQHQQYTPGPSMSSPAPQQQGKQGFFSKIKNNLKGPQQQQQQQQYGQHQYGQQQYGQQQYGGYQQRPPPPGQYYPQPGGYGYPQQQGMYGQQGMMQGRPQRQGMGAGGAAALGVGGGLLGGMMLGNMMGGMGHDDYQDGYQDGMDDGGGDMGGDMGGGDF